MVKEVSITQEITIAYEHKGQVTELKSNTKLMINYTF